MKKSGNQNSFTLLQINSVVNYGSTGRIAEGIGISAIKNGWESYIAFGRKTGLSSSKVIKIGSAADMLLHGFVTRIFDRHGFASINPTRQLIRKIEEIKPDIIQLHNLHGYYINIKLLFNYLSIREIPLVWTLHDCWAITGHCANFESINCMRWTNECHNCPQKHSYPASYCLDQSKLNFSDKKELFTSLKKLTIVSVSNWLSHILQKSYLSKYPIEIINNGIDTDIFKPMQVSELITKFDLDKKFIILGVANDWNSKKGFYDFIELGKKLDSDYQIIMVGLTSYQKRQIPKNIIGIARTDSTQSLAEFYSLADVFLNPTYEESFSTTNLEAAACGTPIVTYDTGGSTESILEETGIVTKKGDITGLIDAVKTVRERGKSYYSQKCYEHIRLNYDKNDRFNIIKLYSKILTM